MCRAFYLCLLMAFSSYTIANGNCTNLAEVDWLQGQWLSTGDKRNTTEHWKRISPSTFEGIGKVSDTRGKVISQESLRLAQMSGSLYYIAKVSHNTLPIAFLATQCSRESVTFENNDHDFPNSLTYVLKNNLLSVKVSDKLGKGFTLQFERQ